MLRRTSKAPIVLSNEQLSFAQPRLAYGINAPMPHWPLVSMRTTQTGRVSSKSNEMMNMCSNSDRRLFVNKSEKRQEPLEKGLIVGESLQPQPTHEQ
jgi:hypothetical protein